SRASCRAKVRPAAPAPQITTSYSVCKPPGKFIDSPSFEDMLDTYLIAVHNAWQERIAQRSYNPYKNNFRKIEGKRWSTDRDGISACTLMVERECRRLFWEKNTRLTAGMQ